MELSDRTLNFLGKPTSDPDFQAFLGELKTLELFERTTHKLYTFSDLGLMFHSYESGTVGSVTFHIHTRMVRHGGVSPYSGLLPFGITTADTRKQVSNKLGIEPYKSTPDEGYPLNPGEEYPTWWDSYSLPTFRVTVIFNSAIDGLEMLSVHYLASET